MVSTNQRHRKLIISLCLIFLIELNLSARGLTADSETSLLNAIIQIESSWNPHATNGISYGLTGITHPCLEHFNQSNGKRYRLDEMFDPQKNLEVARWYLSWLTQFLERRGLYSPEHLLIAWNWGIGRLLQWDGRWERLPRETRAYLAKWKTLSERSSSQL